MNDLNPQFYINPNPSSPETSYDPITHALMTIVTRIDSALGDEVAYHIFNHIRFHTAQENRPVGYQFILPNDSLLTVYDDVVSNRRRLGFHSPRGFGKALELSAAWAWPKRVPDNIGWFTWEMTEKEYRKIMKRIAYAVGVAYANRDNQLRPRTVLVNPYIPPTPLTTSPS